MPYIFQSLASPSSQAFSAGGIKDAMSSMRVSVSKKVRSSVDRLALQNDYSMVSISHIPVELLGDIFRLYTNNPRAAPLGPRSYKAGRNPMVLAQVCSHWRNVATNLPALWTTIRISQPTKCHARLVNLWLERAADQPLDVTLTELDNLIPAWAILTSLVARSEFWKRIHIALPLDLLSRFAQVLQSPRRCNMLESVQFYDHVIVSKQLFDCHIQNPGWTIPYLRDIWTFFYTSTSLRDVVWTGELETLAFNSSPFKQITSIELRFGIALDAEDAVSFMQLFPNLQAFHARISPPSSSHSAWKSHLPTSPITFEHLDTLHLRLDSSISFLFAHITLPALRDLKLWSITCGIPLFHDFAVLDNFFRRSHCQLQKFHYDDRHAPESFMQEWGSLHSLQFLVSIYWTGKISDSTVSLLTRCIENGPHAVMPFLKDLHFTSCDTTDGMIAALLLSRASTLTDCSFYSKKGKGPIDKRALSTWGLS
ncbi:hypothetical protein NLJ89_g3795 [Agrocybe chaxingu]|uniref:F-box domain-containing protein n=1 Tax=Agrocybe chaxingu TaxID=84603 RepID=A0A9W8K3Y0_9AGAR|nr:hypothetical protein NLJ89_g3795 [Agrocybe chaxingu]